MTLVLATLEDLEGALPGVDPAVGQSALDRAAGLVRAIARQDFTFTANDTVRLAGGNRDLVLPQGPLLVDSDHPLTVVEMDDLAGGRVTSVEGTAFARVGQVLSKRYRSQWSPLLPASTGYPLGAFQSGPAGIWAPIVDVTYSHGYQTAPAWLTAIVVNAASQYAVNPNGLWSEQVGGITNQYARSTVGSGGVTAQIKADLKAAGIRTGGAFSIAAT